MSRSWSWGIKGYGRPVRDWEGRGSRRLYAKVAGQKPALKDLPAGARDAAKRWAKDEAKKIRTEAERPRDASVPTAAHVFALYLTTQTPRKGKSCQYEDQRAAKMWTRVLGAKRDLHAITLGEWQAFIDVRGSGAIDARGVPVPAPMTPEDPPRRPVGRRSVEADLCWLRMVLRWACTW